ncbi:hypothetical protein EAH89_26395 [Roseomonas nepalensis]|uniref:Uncharacterized protein n=1 Tax=Muricoccus nepalensis TaxID=1854500 RepID=A0A502F7X6_9PROT|nr:hypothetical protein [Roseomonas nepalensis]TPG45485.1 hypothetical protein EAH89_26395 [Roseomonas nepalensis]
MGAACNALHAAFQLALLDAVRPGMDWQESALALRDARDRLAAPLALADETGAVAPPGALPGTDERSSLFAALQAGFRGAMSTLPVPANAADERPAARLRQA